MAKFFALMAVTMFGMASAGGLGLGGGLGGGGLGGGIGLGGGGIGLGGGLGKFGLDGGLGGIGGIGGIGGGGIGLGGSLGGGIGLGGGYGGGFDGGIGLGGGGGGIVPAAILSQHHVSHYDVPSVGFIHPTTVDVPANILPVNFVFRSASSLINVAHKHEGAKGSFKETVSQDEPHTLVHTVTKPIIQEVKEVISPFRKIVQEVEPVREEIKTLVARGVAHSKGAILGDGGYGGGLGGGFGGGLGGGLGGGFGGGLGGGLGLGGGSLKVNHGTVAIHNGGALKLNHGSAIIHTPDAFKVNHGAIALGGKGLFKGARA